MESKRTMEKGILSEQKWTFPITRVRDPDNISVLPRLSENIYCGHVPPLHRKYMGKQSIPFWFLGLQTSGNNIQNRGRT